MSDLIERQSELQERYEAFQNAGLKLDITRGKPSAEQLDLANEMDGILDGFYMLQDGTDVRNYGGILGIPEARELGGELMEVPAENVMAGGNSSLNLMYEYASAQMAHWRPNGNEEITFLCPVPGYDRHYTVCEHLGIQMLPVPLTDDGPDMDVVEKLVQEDAQIKGIWSVPKYTNPTGQTFSDEVVERMAALPKLASDRFTVFWDNAYIVHDLTETPDQLKNLFTCAEAAGTLDNVVLFASTSKITFAGAGVAYLATSAARLAEFESHLSSHVIGYDKVNQLRHVRFLKNKEGVMAHMAKHRDIIKPKFEMVLSKLNESLDGKEIASWTEPAGGYFISLDTVESIAKEVIAMAGDAGVKLTPAGATFPYKEDPYNTNIRIAPTYPPIDELEKAMDVFVTCLELMHLNHTLDQ